MSKRLEDFKNNFKVKLVPSVIITVSAIVLICGVYYAWAIVMYPLPQVQPKDTLTSTAWNNMVDDITNLNNRVTSLSGGGGATPSLVCTEVTGAMKANGAGGCNGMAACSSGYVATGGVCNTVNGVTSNNIGTNSFSRTSSGGGGNGTSCAGDAMVACCKLQ